MAGMQARQAAAAGQGGVRSFAAEPRRRYDPSMYTHLESWDTPLPPSDEEPEKEELSTLPLASGSTQLWSQTVRAGGSAPDGGGEFMSLLHQGLRDDDGGGVDLRFQLCSGGGREASRTFIIDGDRSARGIEHGRSLHMEQSTLRHAAPVTCAVGPSPAGRQHGSTAPAPVRPRSTVENITRAVSNMRAHSDAGEDDVGFGDDADEGMREDVEAGDDDDDVPIRPLGKTVGRGKGRGRGGVRGRSVGRGGRGGDAGDCMKKWDNLFQNYKKIQRFQNASGRPDFFRLTNEERKEHNFKFHRALYNEIHAGMVGNHTIFPPNVADTGSPDGVQLPRRGAGGGESVCSEAAGEGCPDERSSARESDSNAGSGAGGGKRRNARQHAFETISDVMERHGALMSSTIESSSKRQCSISMRQCNILEQEVAVQKAHYASSDETQRMMCQALFEMAAAIRGRSAIRALHRDRLWGSPASMSARLNARGKKRDVALDKTQAQGKSRRHVPKAKRLRLDDASASLTRRGARGWSQPAEEDNDDDFMTEDDQGEATASAGRESARQRTPDQSASKRMSTPPPEAQQLRVRETWKEKGVVVDLGGEDKEPLERRRLRIATQATTAAVSTARAADDERPITRAVPCTPSQLRQRNDGGDGASRQRGGGGGVVADARAAGGEAAGGAGVADAGVVPPVPAAREEAAVPATVREEGRGQNTNQRDGGEAGSSRACRGVMTNELIDRALLWVDDKSFWTKGEGRRLYNIVHETKEYFVAIASGLPPPQLPRSSTVISIAHSFRAAVQMGAHIDDDFISYERLCRVADCFKLLLAASMWIMHMAGDDPRSHYEAFYFADLVARPTLIASMHRSFDHRRSVVRAANVVTERLGKAKVTLGVYPDYILIGHHATSDLRTTQPSRGQRMRRSWIGWVRAPPMMTSKAKEKTTHKAGWYAGGERGDNASKNEGGCMGGET
ncbi:hypothetical protein CBR_g8456 [Chara braunii]|uniref:Myb-like domain-containing protein n=1 Tax=Chara braunii TaxID=69332 RepID=A0A388KM69_CHABU|nr:hypothetical protein CBR_g8456 [Chara braunii]|eukprot:GBG71154.1 hypothetical protein CBR_g8456 [Chara braunii]